MRETAWRVLGLLLVAGTAGASEGRLATRDGDQIVDVPLRHTEVSIRVTGVVAQVTVEQAFTNPFDRKIEATYLFPLPTRAAVHDLEIVSGGRVVRGQIQRREDARRVYQAAAAKGQVAALLTEERANLFTQSVANLEPGAEIKVRLRYVELLVPEDGGYSLVFPMVAPPRHFPESSKVRPEARALVTPPVLPPGMRPAHDINVTATIEPGLPLARLESPTHQVAIDGGRVTLAAGDRVPNRDFVLRWAIAGKQPGITAAASSGAFFLLLEPPPGAEDRTLAPRELVFVVDTSSSMAGAPLATAKDAVRRALAGMRPDDTFQIVRFGDAASALGPLPLANRPGNLRAALGWLDSLAAQGGTDMTTGIRAALDFPHDAERLRIVFFLTDGWVGNEDEVLAMVGARLGESRLFSLGLGPAPNRYLLEEMAGLGRGTVQIVLPGEDAKAAVARFQARIDRPLLTDVRIDWNGLPVADLTPRTIPDLFLGQPLVIAGRATADARGTVTVHGKLGGRAVSFAVPLALGGDDRPEVAAVWARARIAELERQELRRSRPETIAEITAIALRHRLMTPYTAFVAIDTASATKGPIAERVEVPVHTTPGGGSIPGGSGGGAYGVSFSGGTSFESTYVADGINQSGEVVVIRERSPMIDQGSSKMGVTITQDYLRAVPHRFRTYTLAEDAPTSGDITAAGGAWIGPSGFSGDDDWEPPPPPPVSYLDETRARMAELQQCYPEGAQLEGKLVIKVVIGFGGTATVSVLGVPDGAGDRQALEACVVQVGSHWRFPAPKKIVVVVTGSEGK